MMKTVNFVLILGVFTLPGSSADSRCTSRGGTCKYTRYGCSGGSFTSGLCSGPTSRKCCIKRTGSSADSRCTSRGGTCKYTRYGCSGGSFTSGLCSGPTSRKCCIKRTGACTYTKYGDIMKLSPTGAKAGTARQDNLRTTGVSASQSLVTSDFSALNGKKSCYYKLGRKLCLHPALIAAIASRESRGGRILRSTNGYGDFRDGKYQAYGIIQCDIDNSGLGDRCTSLPWDSCDHMEMVMKEVFLPKIGRVVGKQPTWPPERQLQGAVAAFNFGSKNVQTWGGLDIGTWGHDYSNDVIARAQYLVNHYGWK